VRVLQAQDVPALRSEKLGKFISHVLHSGLAKLCGQTHHLQTQSRTRSKMQGADSLLQMDALIAGYDQGTRDPGIQGARDSPPSYWTTTIFPEHHTTWVFFPTDLISIHHVGSIPFSTAFRQLNFFVSLHAQGRQFSETARFSLLDLIYTRLGAQKQRGTRSEFQF
jgi:hypothetical protein